MLDGPSVGYMDYSCSHGQLSPTPDTLDLDTLPDLGYGNKLMIHTARGVYNRYVIEALAEGKLVAILHCIYSLYLL